MIESNKTKTDSREQSCKYYYIKQNCSHKLSQLQVSNLMLIHVIQGTKKIQYEGIEYKIKSGQMILISAGIVIDITNISSDDDCYLAEVFTWSDECIKNYQLESALDTQIHGEVINVFKPSDMLNWSIDYTKKLIECFSENSNAVFSQFIQLLRCIKSMGISFVNLKKEKPSLKILKLMTLEPNKKWILKDVARHYSMSESTLKRYLSKENTTFTHILYEARMQCALILLQTSTWNISRIAQEIGYESNHRFSKYFYKKFGITPKNFLYLKEKKINESA